MKMKLTLFAWLICSLSYAQTFTSSNLPIVVINTGSPTFDDNTIPDEPKINATMGIIDNGPGILNYLTDPFNHYQGNIGIETRGNSTQGFLKKTYSIELWDALGQDTSASLLGMGGEEDWILHAMVIDKTQLRSPMSFDFSRDAGHYASHWKYVELVIDGDYRGLYILCEKIKRDDDRVDIAKLDADDLAGDSVTGGYILRIDWLDNPQGIQSNYNSQGGIPMVYQYYYPKAANIAPQQTAYIQNYMNQFEDAVFDPSYSNSQGIRYNEYIDITSFVDFLIVNELSKNSDGYKLSSYLYKDKDSKGGKLTAGPIWDFDQTYGMSDVCSCNDYTGWTYLQNQPGCEDFESMPMWWQAMMSDDLFTNHLACRWETLRNGPLHQDSIYAWIDYHTAMLDEALTRNFIKWDFIGQSIWAEPLPIPTTYDGEIQYMKGWIANRLAWLDANMPGNCANDVVNTSEIEAFEIEVYPNPADEVVYIKGVEGMNYRITGSDGRVVHSANGSTSEKIDVSTYQAGVYFVQVNGVNSVLTHKLIIQ